MANDPDRAVRQPLLEERAVTVSHIYKLQRSQLQKLFMEPNPMQRLLSPQYGSTKGVLKKLASDANTGIVGDEKDLARRKAVFGANIKPLPTTPALLDSIKQTCQDKVWMVVAGSAIIAAICGSFSDGSGSLMEGLAILIASVILIAITSLADWLKDRRFVGLQSLIKEDTVAVIRGKFGATQSVSVWDLVVGDVVLLETGANIPCDCLVLEAYDLVVSAMEEDNIERDFPKSPVGENGLEDPFLRMGSNIKRGQTKALVCSVGVCGSGFKDVEKLDTDIDTKLQQKLKNLSDQFTVWGIYGAGIIFISLIVRLVLEISTSSDDIAGILTKKLTGHINLIVVLVVVSIPEGLPLTIGVSLAFTVMRMYSENILVRKLDAPEKMGSVEEILVGKTSTITKNDMKVMQFYCGNSHIVVNRPDAFFNCIQSDHAKRLIKETILYNCEARIEMDATSYVPVGNGTEVGLLKFLQNADIPVHLLIQKKLGKIRMIQPFSSESKRSIVALDNPDKPGVVSVFLKGAPELVLDLCGKWVLNGEGQYEEELDRDTRTATLQIITQMAAEPLRVIGLAYMEMEETQWVDQFEQLFNSKDPLEDQIFTWIGAFGMKDPLRNNVRKCISYAREQGHLSIRMVSGDHIETAKAVAIKAGILKPEEAGRSYAVMTGQDFRNHVGKLTQQSGEIAGVEQTLDNMQGFQEIAANIRVLARASPNDRLLLVTGLKAIGKSVAVTGSGIDDVEALTAADVGLAMGSGCSAAKEAADLVLTDNDFEATLRSVMWGRNIYHNVSRFLQFQVTVNISALATVLIGGFWFGESPLSPVQLLWINLIMDTFAAIALSTEPPLASVLQGVPFKSNASILSGTVWRQILGVSLWNIIVMTFLIVFGALFAGLDYEMKTSSSLLVEPTKPDGYDQMISDGVKCPDANTDCINYNQWEQSVAKRMHYTYIFNTFVFLQLFNEINCRKVGRRDFNVMEKFLHNYYFIGVLAGTFACQILMCKWFPRITGTEQMDKGGWGACIAVGTTNLLVSALLKLTPESWVSNIPTQSMIDEDKQIDNKVLTAWNKKNNAFAADGNSEGAINYGAMSNGGSAADEGDFTKA